MKMIAIGALFILNPITSTYATCTGSTVTKTGPNGKTLTLCMDGRYTTCLRDSQRLGHSHVEAKKFCDGRKAAGAVR